MKKISELGLELIELEGDLLLVDDKKLIINGYIQRGTEKPVINKPDFWFDFGVPYKNVIASTKPLEGLPLLVIEDEVEKLIDEELIKMGHEQKRVRSLIYGEERELAKTLYYKAKETYKFTEEDLKTSIDASKHGYTDDYIINYLTKKQLWVEVEFKETKSSVFRENDNAPYGIYEPKITNNQIKGIYK